MDPDPFSCWSKALKIFYSSTSDVHVITIKSGVSTFVSQRHSLILREQKKTILSTVAIKQPQHCYTPRSYPCCLLSKLLFPLSCPFSAPRQSVTNQTTLVFMRDPPTEKTGYTPANFHRSTLQLLIPALPCCVLRSTAQIFLLHRF